MLHKAVSVLTMTAYWGVEALCRNSI